MAKFEVPVTLTITSVIAVEADGKDDAYNTVFGMKTTALLKKLDIDDSEIDIDRKKITLLDDDEEEDNENAGELDDEEESGFFDEDNETNEDMD